MHDDLVNALCRDYGVHAYGTWRGAFWRLDDPRTADALDMLESKRHPDGSWHVEGRWWKPPGSKGSNVEVADWGGTADDLLSERAVDVLAAAGRA